LPDCYSVRASSAPQRRLPSVGERVLDHVFPHQGLRNGVLILDGFVAVLVQERRPPVLASSAAVLVGDSSGGGVALMAASLAPYRVEAVALLASEGQDA